MIKRTHTCGQLSIKDLKKAISLNGWISKTRDLGSLIFIDLKDRYGTTQVVFNQDTNKDVFNKMKRLGLQDVIGVSGVVVARIIKSISDALSSAISSAFILASRARSQVF